jgi:hypothetical protein
MEGVMGRWRRGPGGAAALVIVGTLLLLGVGRLAAGSLGPPLDGSGDTVIPPTTVGAVVGAPVGAEVGVSQIVFGSGGLWAAATASNQVVRLDSVSARATAVVPVERPLGIATGFGAVWATTVGQRLELVRIDPVGARITARIPLGEVAGVVAAGAGAVWVGCAEGNGPSVLRIDPVAGRVTARIQLPTSVSSGCGVWNVAADGRFVWVADEAGSLWRIEAASNRVTRLAAELSWEGVGRQIGGLTAARGMVWAASDLELVRLDAASGREVLRYGLGQLGGGGKPGLAAITPDAVWVWSGGGLRRFDSDGGLVTGAVPGVVGVSGLAGGAGMLWAITGDGVVRVDLARVS